ncbi:Bug family tripartite tricarboxylate transporter substrate binding protein [Polaromonas sp. CT11-55]|uniref:Bug family tripartite tricarboxylate transporter substrate binding protein n=1 Tax=Polaromonas sp. CT11-55 TaxID=3243045 RepID=UPI0039A5EA4F
MSKFQARLVLLLAAATLAGTVLAADWPATQPIKLIVPSSAGGTPDLTSRKLAYYLQDKLKQSVIVENRPGAAGTIAMQAVATAKPDGYTLGFGNIVTMAINRGLIAKMPYNPDKDLAPVAVLSQVPNVLVVRQGLPITSVRELVIYAKSHPGRLAMGSGGNGTTSHLSGEILKEKAGISFSHIPYRGAPQAQSDLIGGQIDFMFDNLPSMVGAVQSGKVRPLAVTSKRRSALLPDVPTMEEAGIAGFEVVAWGGIVAPAGTPRPVILRLNREINNWLQAPATKAEFAQTGQVALGGSPEFFKTHIDSEAKKWGDVIRTAGVKLD